MIIIDFLKIKILFLVILAIFTTMFLTPITSNAHSIDMSISDFETSNKFTDNKTHSQQCSDMTFCNFPTALLNNFEFIQMLEFVSLEFNIHYEQKIFDPTTFDPPPPRLFS